MRNLITMCAAAGLALSVAGCGDDDDEPSDSTNGPGTIDAGGEMDAGNGGMEEPADIVDTAIAADGFDSLVAAVQKADLVDTLKGEGPFTVFAPTDDAFAALLDDLGVTLDDLTAEDLTPILTYHVVPGELFAEDVVTLSEATTVQGSDIRIAVSNGNVVLNDDVNIIVTDIDASNGVIHVIDKVLLPPSE